MASPAAKRTPFTYRDYCLLPEDGRIHELIEGDFFVSPAPATLHQTVSRKLQFALMEALEKPGLAQIFDAPTDLILEDISTVQPDLIIVGADRAHVVTQRAIEGVPSAVVEILSPGSQDRDRYIKLALYQRFAIPEYWIVDPDHGFITALRIKDGEYIERARYDRASTLVSPDFPELHIPLEPLFRR
jgi:Uma2 family endonuclease